MPLDLAKTFNTATLSRYKAAIPYAGSQRYFAVATISIMAVIGGLVTPFANVPMLPIPGYLTAFSAAMIVINVLVAAILFSRGAIEHRSDVTALGSAYLYVAVIFIPLVASFPGTLMTGPLIGAPGSSVWIWLYWHAGFGLAILRYTHIATRPQKRDASAVREAAAVVAIATALVISATAFLRYLPATVAHGEVSFGGWGACIPLAVLAILAVASIRVACLGTRTPIQLWLSVAMVAACFDVWLTYEGTEKFTLGWYIAKGGSLSTSLAVLISLLHQINTLYSRAAAANEVLQGLTRRDGMTGLTNRRGLDEVMAAEWRKSRRESQPLSLLMVDVDHFKRFNDRYGHPAGDNCLCQVANALLAVARRPGDTVARYGGEEFVMLLPSTDAAGAVDMATRVRAAVRAIAMPHADSPHGIVTVSIGLGSMIGTETGDAGALIAAADRGLYRAKAAGRDTFCRATDGELAVGASLLATIGISSNVSLAAAPAAPKRVSFQPAPAPAGRGEALAGLRLPRSVGTTPSALYDLQGDVLEAVAAGRSLEHVADQLCLGVERLAPGVACSVMLVDQAGRMHMLAAPSLPDAVARAMQDVQIGPNVACCGSAAYHGLPIEAADIKTDPRWLLFKDPAVAAGLRACWSSPIKGRDGRVVGTFAFYYRTGRPPSAFERHIVDKVVHLCALAIEHSAIVSRLEEANRRFDIALSNMSQGLCFFSKGRLVVANRRYAELYDLPPDAIGPGTTLQQIVALRAAVGSGPVMSAKHYMDWRTTVHALDKPSDTIVELENGRTIAIHHQPMPNDEWVATHEDITERRRAEAELLYLTRHDVLTGLPNRAMFQDRIRQGLALLGRGQRCAVLSLDVDHFKQVNDIFGHAVGDRLLQAISERLQACVREVDTVARLGGDEFAVLLVGLDRPESAGELAQRIIAALSDPFELDGHTVVVGATIGIAIPPVDGASPAKVLQSSDTALYRAKQDGRGTYRFFEPEMDARLQARFALERDLRQAVRDEAFELVFQPLYNLDANQVSGFEALLRWRHPERGVVSPGEFIPLLEETGLIVPLGMWVLQRACAEAASWPVPVKVAVNLSAVQFKTKGLVEAVQLALLTTGLPAKRLELEITETVLLKEGTDTLATLHGLHDLGVSIAMDDFGTGYSSLSYLRSFPFDKIKIDQSFIRDITEREDSMAIIRAVVGMGRSMGMVTTAEGVETEDQLAHLRREGCTEIQGYLLSRPMSGEAARQMLAADEPVDHLTLARSMRQRASA
jgi:diguanylate cyclase (GGDEF)-like protein